MEEVAYWHLRSIFIYQKWWVIDIGCRSSFDIPHFAFQYSCINKSKKTNIFYNINEKNPICGIELRKQDDFNRV